ncbi:MAG: hypothetical protein LIQ31_03545 [Planctomycetes bacterium]|nr:hypothetical protein [Planctomycetota bacterium]
MKPRGSQVQFRPWLGYVLAVLAGAACVYGAFRLYRSQTRQPLTLRLVSDTTSGQRRMVLRLANSGREDLVVNTGAMGFFMAVLENGVREAVVQIQSEEGPGADGRDGRVIRPGEHLDLGDVYPDVRNLPEGRVVLRAVYTATGPDDGQTPYWRGVVHSPPLTFDITRN